MTLRVKTLIIIGVLLVGLIAVLYTTSRIVLLGSFAELEEQHTRENVERVVSALADALSAFYGTARDYAESDRTHAFMQGAFDDYVKSELPDQALIGLRINLLLLIDSSGRLVFGKGFDLNTAKEIPFPENFQEHLTAVSSRLHHFDGGSSIAGIILLPENPMLIVARPILTSEGRGPVGGTLIMGRYLDSAEIKRLAETTYLSVTILRFDEAQKYPDFRTAISALSYDAEIVVQPLSTPVIAGYTLLKDIYGKPSLVMRVDGTRSIYTHGRAAMLYFILSVLGVGLIFSGGTLFLLEKVILSRLTRLSANVTGIGKSSDLSARVSLAGKDELSSLADSINNMLAALEQSHILLQQRQEALQHRVEFEEIITGISTKFINLAPSEMNAGINQALQTIGEFAGVDRSYVFLLSETGAKVDNTHEWCAKGIEPQIDRLKGLSVDAFPWLMRKFKQFETVYIPRVADLAPEASAEKAELESESIKSLVCVPMVCGGAVIGFLGFDSVRTEKTWNEETIALLRIVGEIFVNALERKRAEEHRLGLERKLLETQKLESLGMMAGGIAHDFNNLLVGILGNAGLALLELPPNSPGRAAVEQIESAAKRAADLTRQLLAYSGRGRFVIQRLDLNIIAEEMVGLLRTSISKNTVLQFNFATNLPAIEGDPAQMRQAAMNILTNAADAISEAPGIVTLTTGVMWANRSYLADTCFNPDLPEGNYVFLEISDTGCGMDAATKAKIFDPFFTTKFPGRGLGLAAVLGIVRSHKGALKVESEPGCGTTFRILFPCVETTAEVIPVGKNLSEKWHTRGTVLIVDDDTAVRNVAMWILKRIGFKVLTAADGRAGIEIFRAHLNAIDCILLDMTMPQFSGEATMREIRRLKPEARVVLMSGYSEQEVTERFAGTGLADFLQKPFTPDDLSQKMQNVLSQAQ